MDGQRTGPEAQTPPTRMRVLGGDVDAVTPAQVLALVDQRIAEGRGAVIANHNLHSLYLLRRSADMRSFYALADLIEADSTPMILWARLLGLPISRRHRCTYLDWRELFWSLASARGWRVFYLGGEPGIAASGAAAVKQRWPGAAIIVRHGRFEPSRTGPENAEVLAAIGSAQPHVLFVGMGMPRQEAWILDNLDRLGGCVIFSVGAAFDYEAGAIPTPPRWTGRMGLEWLFRFASEPRRLFSRYMIEPWSLILPAMEDIWAAARPRGRTT